jgi:2,4-dienoyl-CoA reductase (NADPH2)
VTLFERAARIGGQLNLARVIPGKEEFDGLVDWFGRELVRSGVDVRLQSAPNADDLAAFDAVVVATGVRPRDPAIPVVAEPGAAGPRVLSYLDVLTGAPVGRNVAIIGAGGIGFDVAAFLVSDGHSATLDLDQWRAEWGVGDPARTGGGLAPEGPRPVPPARQVTLLQRKAGTPGKGLGKTTGWIHRAHLAAKGVRMIGGVTYDRIDRDGLHLRTGADGTPTVLAADTIVTCAGQQVHRPDWAASWTDPTKLHVIGGADHAAELDAKRAIDQGVRLAARL